MVPILPDTLDFLPKMSKSRQKEMILDKSGEIRSLRQHGVALAKSIPKPIYRPTQKEINWIFYDILISVRKSSTDPYLETYSKILRKQYPWKICHWCINFYQVWRSLRLHCHVPLPVQDATIYYTLVSPFPPGFEPPRHLRQILSFHKVMLALYRNYFKELKKLALQEILTSPELTTKIIHGEIIPYKYTEIVPWVKIYDGVLTYLQNRPTKLQALNLDQDTLAILNRSIDINRFKTLSRASTGLFKELDKVIKDKGCTPEEAYRLLQENK